MSTTLPAADRGLSPADFELVATVVRAEAAIVLDAGKEYLVESRLRPLAHNAGYESIAALVDDLRRRPGGPLRDLVIEAMTTNETSFFRDVHPFEALKAVVLPEAIERNAHERRLRIWCGASSSGQEPYTLAMVLRQHFPTLEAWDLSILCTDISPAMVARTAAGTYSQLEVNRGLAAPLLVRWFTQQGTAWEAKPALRDLISVRQLNLVGPWPAMGPFDVVFLRNVLIYFDVQDKTKVLEKVAGTLRPGGSLFLGAAETTLGVTDRYVRRTHGSASWYERT